MINFKFGSAVRLSSLKVLQERKPSNFICKCFYTRRKVCWGGGDLEQKSSTRTALVMVNIANLRASANASGWMQVLDPQTRKRGRPDNQILFSKQYS